MTSIPHSLMLDNFEFLVWSKDANGVFLDVNDKFAMVAGFDDINLIIGKTDFDIWPYELALGYKIDDDFVMKSKVPKKVIEEVLDKVGMKGFAPKMPHQLSGGEQQRIGIARALLIDPELILADEPTGNLDPQTSIEIMEVLRKIHENGKTILMATHDYALVLKYPSKTLKFDEGKMFEVVQRVV